GSEDTVIPLVAGEDVARVAAGVLASDAVVPGASCPVIGQVLTLREIIATFAKVLGRPVRYQEIPDDAWHAGALARGVNAHAAEHLSQLWRALRANPTRFGPTDAME